MMTTNDWQTLLDLLDSGQTPFVDRAILPTGSAFHYTTHGHAIEGSGGFLGAPLDRNIGCTQAGAISPPATDPRGVVFAYESLADTRSEGPRDCEVFCIRYARAISALHAEEAAMAEQARTSLRGALGRQLSEADTSEFGTPRTIIILVDDIEGFHRAD